MVHIAVPGTVCTIPRSCRAKRQRKRPRTETNTLNSCLRISLLGILAVYMEFGNLRLQESWYVVDFSWCTLKEGSVVRCEQHPVFSVGDSCCLKQL